MNNIKQQCKYCGKEFTTNNILKHERRHELHPETFDEPKYKLTHDGLSCQFCGKLCKNTNSLCNHERLCKHNPSKQESNLAQSFATGHIAWNKGLTKETDSRVANNGEQIRQYYKVNVSPRLGIPLTEQHKASISKTILEKSKRGEWHTSLARKMHFKYKGNDLHGSWELAYAMYLDDNSIKWERCKKRFSYYYEGSLHYYTPDFYLLDTNSYIEVKGFKTDKDDAKWRQFPKSESLTVLFYNDLKELGIDIK